MLANRLSQFEIRADIAEDAAMELRSARYVYSTDCVYIHPDGADTVCENGGDRIVLCRMDPAQAYELIQDTFDFYRRWEQGLRQAREDGDYRRIIRKSYLLFHAPVMLIDYNTRLLACTEEFRNQPVDAEWDHYMAHGCASLAGQQSIQRMKREGAQFHRPGTAYHVMRGGGLTNLLTCPLQQDGVYYGRVNVLEYGRRLNPGDRQVLALLGEALLDIFRQRAPEEYADPGLLLGRALERGDREALTSLAAVLGAVDEPMVLLSLAVPSLTANEKLRGSAANLLRELLPGAVAADCGERLCLLMPARWTAERLADRLRTGLSGVPFRGALSLPFRELAGLRAARDQCRYLQERAGAGGGQEVADFYPVAMEYLIRCGDEALRRAALHPDARRLAAGGEAGRRQMEILCGYLRHKKSLVPTAKALYMHRNTLVYQLGHIRETLTADLSDPYACEYLRLSLRYLMEP